MLVSFDCILVRPKEGQIVKGTVVSQSELGLEVRLCAEHVTCTVPGKDLHEPARSRFDEKKEQLVWMPDSAEGQPCLYYENDRPIKVRMTKTDGVLEATCNEDGLGMVGWGNWNT